MKAAFLRLTTSVLMLALLLIGASSTVHAFTKDVELVVPDTSLVVNGFAAPGALVSIYDGEALIGTVLADSNGQFSKEFISIENGLHTLRLEYEDTDGRASTPITDTINTRFQQETVVEYYLPPTFELLPSSVVQGGLVAIQGQSIPGATVEITLDGGNIILRPVTGPDGRFSVAVDTDGYFIGDHSARAIARKGDLTSFDTNVSSFTVLPTDGSTIEEENNDSGLAAPIITSPTSPYSASDETQTIRGTAAPNSQVIIYMDGAPIGSTFANNDGNWFFNIAITQPFHEISAVACENGSCSDFSNTLGVRFIGDFSQCTTFRFSLLEYRFWGSNPDQGIDLEVDEINGVGPFEMIVEWGDTTVERFNHEDTNYFTIHHVYKEVGQYNGSITMRDGDCEYTRYFSVDVVASGLNVLDFWWVLIPTGALVSAAWWFRHVHEHESHARKNSRKRR